ncbi:MULTISPECIES: OmpA family protein [unclassified Empedobacter]|uniref:OmpA family protein n=1 Tax=unclassified Empedobacter TaxID=2643773 RepID=UPI0025C4718B|nr:MULTISPECIES: OmpA family protein [unclassified Empedobacter]
MELQNEEDFEKIEAISLENDYNFHHLLGNLSHNFTFQNNSSEDILAKFIYPYQASQNVYELKAFVNDKVFEIQSKSIVDIRKELKNIDASTIFKNQQNNQVLQLDLGKIPAHATLKIQLKVSKIIEENSLNYQVSFLEFIVKRTESFTQIHRWNNQLNGYPKNINSVIHLSGNFPISKIVSDLKFSKENDRNYVSKNFDKKIPTLQYAYTKNELQTGIETFTENGCDYILGTIEPANNPSKYNAPREFLFVLDASGSMMNQPIETTKKLMNQLLPNLNETDKFNVLIYSTKNELVFKESQFSTKENINLALKKINSLNGTGEKLLDEAIEQIQKNPFDKNYKRIIAIISDGAINLNETVYNSLRNYAKDTQFITLGIGKELDYRAMNFISLATGTLPITVNEPKELNQKTAQFQQAVLNSSIYHLKVQSSQINLNETFPKNFNTYLAQNSVNFVSRDCNRRYPKKIKIIGLQSNQNFTQNFEIKQPNPSEFTEAIKFYWAKQKIDYLLKDEERCGEMCKKDGRYRKEIEKIGTEFNISTPYNLLIQKGNIENYNNDYDTDADGVMDIEDECPYIKGNRFGNGCPESNLSDKKIGNYVQDYSNYLMETVEFDFNKAEIRAIDYPKLNEVVAIMKRNPSLHFIIEGHTDAVGTESYNFDLSQRRANAVLNYLVEKGLNKNRFSISAKGFSDLKYKECNPATNCIDWKNFENRRVRFRIK